MPKGTKGHDAEQPPKGPSAVRQKRLQAERERGNFALGSAQATQRLLSAACHLALRLYRRAADITPGEQEHTSLQAQHGKTQRDQRRQRLVRETGNQWPVEAVIIDWREVLQPRAAQFPTHHVQQNQKE